MSEDTEKKSSAKPATPAKSVSVNIEWTPGETGIPVEYDQKPTLGSVIDQKAPALLAAGSVATVSGVVGCVAPLLSAGATAGTAAAGIGVGIGAATIATVAGVGVGVIAAGAAVYVGYELDQQLEKREDDKLQRLVDDLYTRNLPLMKTVAKCAGYSGNLDANAVEKIVTREHLFSSNPLHNLDGSLNGNKDGKVTTEELERNLKQFIAEEGHGLPPSASLAQNTKSSAQR